MKTLKLLLCFSLFIFHFSFSFGQSWAWGAQGIPGNKANDLGSGVAVDKAGNAYMTGYFIPNIKFDTIMDSSFTNGTFYLVKYNSLGKALWVVNPVGHAYGLAAATDNNGDVFSTGVFVTTLKFGSFTLSGADDTYLAKYDSNGNFKWAAGSQSGTGFSQGSAVATDKFGNVFVAGYFLDSTQFGATTLYTHSTMSEYYNTFLVKYNSNGTLLWVKQGVGHTSDTSYYNYCYSVATDDLGNSYITGTFQDTVYFGTHCLASADNENVFLVKYDVNGNVLWARQSDTAGYGYSVTADNAGNAYITGSFTSNITFGTYSLTGGGLFFVKYDANGNVKWAQSTPEYGGYGVSADKMGHVYLSGGVGLGPVTFGSYTLDSIPGINNSGNSFIIRFDTLGTALCGKMLYNGCEGFLYPCNVVVSDSSGRYIYTAGTFEDDSIFCAKDTLIATHGTVPFLARWLNCSGEVLGTTDLKPTNEKLTVYPNPFTNTTTIALTTQYSVPTTHYLELDDLTGRKLRWIEFTGTQYQLQANDLAKGIYFIRVFDSDMNVIGTSKIIIQ